MNKETKDKAVPQLRFPEFADSGKWSKTPFGKIFSRIKTKNAENNQNVLTISAQQGLVSQLDYFNKYIAGKDLTGYFLLKKNDFAYNKSYSQGFPMGAIKRLNNYDKGVVSTLYICFRNKNNDEVDFFEQYFNAGLLNPEINKIAQEGARNHGLLNISVKEFFEKINVLKPAEICEQQKIADCLSSIDDTITAQTEKIQKLKAHKTGLMQLLFPAEGKTVPKLRFQRFLNQSGWPRKKLDDVLIEHREKSTGNEKVYSVSVHKGLVDQIEHLGRSFAAIDTAHYKRVLPGDIVYTKSPTGSFPFGIIKQSKIPFPVIVSPLYGVFTPETFSLGYILDSFFESPVNVNNYLSSFVQKGAKNTINISNKTFLSNYLNLPDNPAEQQKIADCLASLDELISAESDKLEFLKAHKKGLLQQLFPTIDHV